VIFHNLIRENTCSIGETFERASQEYNSIFEVLGNRRKNVQYCLNGVQEECDIK